MFTWFYRITAIDGLRNLWSILGHGPSLDEARRNAFKNFIRARKDLGSLKVQKVETKETSYD